LPVGAHIQVTTSGLDKVEKGFEKAEKSVRKGGTASAAASATMEKSLGGVTSKIERSTLPAIDRVAQGFERTERAARKGGGAGLAMTEKLEKAFGGVTSKVTSVYGAIGGIGLVAGAKRVLDFDSGIGQLQADMGASTEEAMALRTQILNLSSAHGVAKEEVVEATQVFQDFGGIVRQGLPILGDLTRISKATGAPMAALATIASTLIQTLGMSPTEAVEAITQFSDQSLKGQIALRNLAKIIPEVMAGGVGAGFGGGRAIGQLGTLLQVAGQASGGKADLARTGALALMRDLKEKAKDLGKLGIRVFDKKGSLRDIDEIMKAIVLKTKGTMRTRKGQSLFSEESSKVAGIYASMVDASTGEYKATSTQKIVSGATGGMQAIEEQYKRRVEGVASEAEKVKRALASLEAGLMQHGGAMIKWLSENPGKAAALVGGGILTGKSLFPFVKSLFKLRGGFGGMLGAEGAAGGAGGPLSDVQKVFVVNMAGGLGGVGGSGPGGVAGAAGTATTRLEKLGAAANVAQGVLASFGMGFGVGTILDQALGISDAASKGMVHPQREAGKIVADEWGKGVRFQRALELTSTLTDMARRGVTVQGAGGQRVALTRDEIIGRVLSSAKKTGMSGEELRLLAAGLRELTLAVRQNPVAVTVKPAGGIDRVDVGLSRGSNR